VCCSSAKEQIRRRPASSRRSRPRRRGRAPAPIRLAGLHGLPEQLGGEPPELGSERRRARRQRGRGTATTAPNTGPAHRAMSGGAPRCRRCGGADGGGVVVERRRLVRRRGKTGQRRQESGGGESSPRGKAVARVRHPEFVGFQLAGQFRPGLNSVWIS
jgi:hypothetical protein